jgi:beta-lactam-binding protein with PASTA domain
MRVLAPSPKPPPPSLPCVVPNVVGKKLAKAKAAITDAHCKVGKVTKKKSSAKPGRVLSEKPNPGAVRAGGSKVALVVSKR